MIFLYGVLLGSFYNVVGWRVPMKKSIAKPRSSCENCGHKLVIWELIPIISYILLRGKCRQCKSNISSLYMITELLTGILFTLVLIHKGFSLEAIIGLTLVSLLVIITVSDILYMLIPNKVLLFFFALFLVERLFIPLIPWYDSIIGGTVAFALLLTIGVVSKGGMGGGDIKLFALLGFALGMKIVLLSFILATLLGAVGGMIGLRAGVFQKGKPIPFGPFIAVGTLLSYFYHEIIISWVFPY
ncbi:prepilin peptidase [Bacillus spongiae]|uniref:Prepilin peptidase n=2 Tax=Bacillus spongiae TaxID=2683610 RepID=A0ABU8H911_9BACI